jgi:HAE1 family hydrophobic/amphiphilic exporter-1
MVMSLIVSSDAMSLRTLTELSDKQIARAIQTVNGVGEVSLAGGRAREIHIVVDIEKLNSYGLSMTQVRDSLVAENVEILAARWSRKGTTVLRTLGRVDAVQDFNALVVATRSGTPIRISNIGYAEDTSERPTSAVWLGNTPAVMIDVRRAMGEHRRGHRRRPRQAREDQAVAPDRGHHHDHQRRLAVHLRLHRITRRHLSTGRCSRRSS